MPEVNISFGDFFDRWSILKVKQRKLEATQLNNVEQELKGYESILEKSIASLAIIGDLANELLLCNERIWDSMSELYETAKSPSRELSDLTLLITQLNQQRAFIKRSIDLAMHSDFHEEKSYFTNANEVLAD